jgi:hypothetical protein
MTVQLRRVTYIYYMLNNCTWETFLISTYPLEARQLRCILKLPKVDVDEQQ